MRYTLFSGCTTDDGPFPRWARDPIIGYLRQGGRSGDIIVIDRNSAAQAFAALLARRRFGRNAKAKFVQPDGDAQGRAGSFYSVHIYKHGKNGVYIGEQIRFFVVEEGR